MAPMVELPDDDLGELSEEDIKNIQQSVFEELGDD